MVCFAGSVWVDVDWCGLCVLQALFGWMLIGVGGVFLQALFGWMLIGVGCVFRRLCFD